MYSNDVQWLSQNIFTHRDKEYGTDGYMRVSISTNTKDSLSFSAPTFVISIQNSGLNKTCVLSYQKLFAVRDRLKEVIPAAVQEYKSKDGSPEAQLHYKSGKSSFLTFEFLRGSQQNEPCVRITISHGTSDSVKIIMPFEPEFISFIKLIGDMVGDQRKYLDWCLHLPNRFFMAEVNQVIKQIPGLIKGAVVQIDRATSEGVSSPTSSPSSSCTTSLDPDPEESDKEIDKENIEATTETIDEMKAFIGDDMSNIDLAIPASVQIKEDKPKPVESSENKAIKWLGGDARNFENLIQRCTERPNSIRQLEKELSENYEDFEFFPGATKKEMKSLIYLSGREFFVYNQMANKQSLDRSFSINKYKGQKFAKPQNLELAYNLLVLTTFIKLCRDKIEAKTKDNYENKTIAHLAASMTAIPFIFSFISSGTELASIIKEKYRQMNEAGMFKSYEKSEFQSYGFTITERDIVDACDAFTENYFSSKSYKSDTFMRHVSMFNNQSCLLGPDNTLNEEQIIKQLVPFEIHIIQSDISLDDRKTMLAYAKENKIDTDVTSVFVKSVPSKNIPIVKFFENNLTEVPEDVRSEFMQSIMEYNDTDYDLSDNKFPYGSFGEEAIKALFLWKPETGEKFKTYKKFQKSIASTVHDKSTILSMSTHDEKDEETTGETFADYFATGKEI